MKRFLMFFLLFSSLIAHEADFDFYMGEKTKHWSYLQEAADLVLYKRFKTLYEKNQHLRLLPSKEAKIPHVVHFIWLGPKSFPAESVENVRTWIAKNPGWKVKFWTDRDRPIPCAGVEKIVFQDYPFPYLKKYYEETENWGEKSDLLRFEILFQEGGAYADHDANCLIPFAGLHGAYDFYCALEAPHPPFAGRALTVGIGVLGSRPGHPIVKRWIDHVAAHWDAVGEKYPGKDGYSKTQVVIERTYLPLTDVLRKLIGQDENVNIVLPAAFFFAKAGLKPVYSQHFFADSWASGHANRDFERQTRKELSQIDKKTNNLLYFSLALISFNVILILFCIFLFRKVRSA
jgi:hypothetical protein